MASIPQQVDLLEALRMLVGEPGSRYGEYVCWIAETFHCSQRAAKDALGILASAGYVERSKDPADRRYRRYWPTAKGERLIESDRAAVVLSYARGLFSTCREPAGVDVEERRRRLERCEALLAGSHRLDLGGEFTLAARYTKADLPLPAVQIDPLSAPLQALISDPRCKVCGSSLREEIDRRIASGETQAAVRRHANALIGSDYFTANNISRHVRSHFTEQPPELRELLHLRLRQEQLQREATMSYLEQIVLIGLAAIQAEITQPTARDILAILAYREAHLDSVADGVDEYGEVISEFRMFIDAVHEAAGDELFAQILETYAKLAVDGHQDRAYEARRRLVEPSFSL